MTFRMSRPPSSWSVGLPFYYGWVIIGIAFVTMAIGVSARTAFSLLMPPLIDEFGWDRGLAAGAFSFGFLVSALVSPIVGRVMDVRGPRPVLLLGITLMSSGLMLAQFIDRPWHLYATLGVLVGGGANMMTYTAHSQFLPNWFVRRRGLAISIAFAGVGVGAIVLLPWLQAIILTQGWRAACWAMGLLVLLALAPQFTGMEASSRDRTTARWRQSATACCIPTRCVVQRRGSDLGGRRMDAGTGRKNGPLLVDRTRVLLRSGCLVRGPGAPDQVPT
jgi:MFS family permease